MADYHSYAPRDGHGLKYSPFKGMVVPRPIAWVTSMGPEDTINLAPFSYYNAVYDDPPMLAFSPTSGKDTEVNIARTREFTLNLTSRAMADEMIATSAGVAPDVSEVEMVGLEMIASDEVAPPRVAGAPAAFECRLSEIIRVRDSGGSETPGRLVIGEVVRIHIDTRFIVDGRFDAIKAGLIARGGYRDYYALGEKFEMVRPAQ